MKKTKISKGLLILLLASIFTLGFKSSANSDIKSSGKPVVTVKSAKTTFIDPSNLVQGGYYYYWDHGSGAMVAQYDRYENGTIYNYYSITPLQSLFTPNSTISVEDAGNITLASLAQILQLLRSIVAGIFVP